MSYPRTLKSRNWCSLTLFAENQLDLALLSVSFFQRSLKDSYLLIRGSVLRVLACIRVPVIAPLILFAIKKFSHDMSLYVRKTAALSIPKLLSLDQEQREEAISLIEMLLKDRTTHVLGRGIWRKKTKTWTWIWKCCCWNETLPFCPIVQTSQSSLRLSSPFGLTSWAENVNIALILREFQVHGIGSKHPWRKTMEKTRSIHHRLLKPWLRWRDLERILWSTA